MFRRVVCLVADGFGVGAAPDADQYGDVGSNTLGNCAQAVGGLSLPNLEKLGIGLLGRFKGISPTHTPKAVVARMAEMSRGKDTTTGHWELSGQIVHQPFAVFPTGFPQELVDAFVRQAEIPGILGNCAASGTEIIERLGEEHLRTGKPILYTSADSVFQLAAHEEAFGLSRLLEICRVARRMTLDFQIGRIIARPFTGEVGTFSRTENRRDFSIPPGRNLLDILGENSISVYSVGKIEDIFDHRGIHFGDHTGNNRDTLRATHSFFHRAHKDRSFIFANLVDFDMLYGHRRDPVGYARALSDFDDFLPELLSRFEDGDCLMITSDHGCDPTFRGTDHTREFVPMIAFTQACRGGKVPDRASFSDVAATILQGFGIDAAVPNTHAESFYSLL